MSRTLQQHVTVLLNQLRSNLHHQQRRIDKVINRTLLQLHQSLYPPHHLLQQTTVNQPVNHHLVNLVQSYLRQFAITTQLLNPQSILIHTLHIQRQQTLSSHLRNYILQLTRSKIFVSTAQRIIHRQLFSTQQQSQL